MTYRELLTLIYGLGRFGIKPGLTRIRALLAALSNPQDGVEVIHVAGTNGKGSTSAFLAAILSESGYRTGLFTSPHLVHFTERIRIDGKEIPEEDAVIIAEKVLAAAPQGTTFFEIVTAMAYLYFAEQGVGPAVMEVGMGGRLDATNAAAGMLSVITPISMDHCEHLGDNLAQIAREKGGVIKRGRPVVLSSQPDEVKNVIRDSAIELSSPLYVDGSEFSANWQSDGLSFRGTKWSMNGLKPGIPGLYQDMNAASALCAAELIDAGGFPIGEAAARRGIEAARWPGRMEILGNGPRILLDGAHNPAGAVALARSLKDIRRGRLILVIGVMESKDVSGILAPLLPHADQVMAVAPELPRALESGALFSRCAAASCLAVDAGTVEAGIRKAVEVSTPDDLIVVCGSLFTVGEARAFLLHTDYEAFRG